MHEILYGCERPFPDYPSPEPTDEDWPRLPDAADGTAGEKCIRFKFQETPASVHNKAVNSHVTNVIEKLRGSWPRVTATDQINARNLPRRFFENTGRDQIAALRKAWMRQQQHKAPLVDVNGDPLVEGEGHDYQRSLTAKRTLHRERRVTATHVVGANIPYSKYSGDQYRILRTVHAQLNQISTGSRRELVPSTWRSKEVSQEPRSNCGADVSMRT